eukprot:TRINITY_DN2871_c0_g1_i1.p1 TRINITY_DN2871_c0_g1~~TRINITY_DN2871_c0_g1_i1.p1  ORF type:complete len:445 (-),score=105.98 TRINITY_DN2871_c0_g1_i1:63-1397(-)
MTSPNSAVQNCFQKLEPKSLFFSRLSGTFTEQGDAETERDIRGFALKFYTEEGNWDLMTINVPVFNCRDMKLGPDAVHAFKRDPRTGFYNLTQLWDFVATHPEGLHNALMFYSDIGGTPMSYRTMDAYGCNTYSFINANKERFWVKFHLISNQGIMGFDFRTARMVAGEDPSFLSRDLRESIEKGNFPQWKLCVQIMNEDEGYKNPFTFDCTKVWKHEDYPLIDIGVLELNRNPVDYFAEVEQVAFSPANNVPGIGFSPDKLLQGRLFVYDDTQNHRLGPNFKQIWINRPHSVEPNTTYVGGQHRAEVKNKFPAYYPSSFGGVTPDPKFVEPPMRCDGNAGFYDYPADGTDDDYYLQARDFLEILSPQQREHLVMNIAHSLMKVEAGTVAKILPHFNKINKSLGTKVQEFLNLQVSEKIPLSGAEQKLFESMRMLSMVDSTAKH